MHEGSGGAKNLRRQNQRLRLPATSGRMTTRTSVHPPTNLDLASGLTCAYDACNRLTEVKQGEAMVAKAYDGVGRWVERGIDGQSPDDQNGVDLYRHFFCDEGWRVVGTRLTYRKGQRRSWA